jgi:hypothetical protein
VVLGAFKLLVGCSSSIVRTLPCCIFGVVFWMGAMERSYLHVILFFGFWVFSSEINCRNLERLGWFPSLDI